MSKKQVLSENDLLTDPFDQFADWYKMHSDACSIYPEALSLGTADPDGRVSVRTVLLKEFNKSGFLFFTNYLSKKGRQLSLNRNAAMLFYWPESARQVRVEGSVEKLSSKESEIYFKSRPRESRIGAWASLQSSVIPHRKHLEDLFLHYEEKFKDLEVPKPEYWGGYRLIPDWFEFWQEGSHRLHDRIIYRLSSDGWIRERLSP